jgi:hypothetical protein
MCHEPLTAEKRLIPIERRYEKPTDTRAKEFLSPQAAAHRPAEVGAPVGTARVSRRFLAAISALLLWQLVSCPSDRVSNDSASRV